MFSQHRGLGDSSTCTPGTLFPNKGHFVQKTHSPLQPGRQKPLANSKIGLQSFKMKLERKTKAGSVRAARARVTTYRWGPVPTRRLASENAASFSPVISASASQLCLPRHLSRAYLGRGQKMARCAPKDPSEQNVAKLCAAEGRLATSQRPQVLLTRELALGPGAHSASSLRPGLPPSGVRVVGRPSPWLPCRSGAAGLRTERQSHPSPPRPCPLLWASAARELESQARQGSPRRVMNSQGHGQLPPATLVPVRLNTAIGVVHPAPSTGEPSARSGGRRDSHPSAAVGSGDSEGSRG